MSSFFEDMEPLLLLSSKFRNFSGMAIKQVTDSMSTVPCRGGDAEAEVMACRDESASLRLKIMAIVAILFAGVMGVTIPLIGMKRRLVRTDSGYFAFFKAFAAGVILATGFVHMLPDGQSALSDPCLPKSPWSDFPFSGFVAMLAALATMVGDFLATQFYERKHRMEEEEVVSVRGGKPSSSVVVVDEDGIGIVVDETGVVGEWQRGKCEEDGDGMHAHHAASHRHGHKRGDGGHGACDGHVHSHTHTLEEGGGGGPSSQVRHVVISQILEVGIVSHSVIIGLSLGVSHSRCTIRPLIGALSFHQFFEGFALGGCISQAKFQNLAATLMACFFALTTPAGIAAGTAVASFYDANSPRALVVEGVFDCVSAGILIYMALVDLIAADFLSRNKSSNIRLQALSHLALFLGAGSMSLLALWA